MIVHREEVKNYSPSASDLTLRPVSLSTFPPSGFLSSDLRGLIEDLSSQSIKAIALIELTLQGTK